jgi:predicted Zn-dependent protease with MMP-like domain
VFPLGTFIKPVWVRLKGLKDELDLKEFKALVDRALKDIPEEFLKLLENLEIFIEKEPSPDLLNELGLRPGDILFGLYQGVPRPDRHFFQTIILPDRITLFQKSFLHTCPSEGKMLEQIRRTLVHEIAHHFGFSERRIRQLGY